MDQFCTWCKSGLIELWLWINQLWIKCGSQILFDDFKHYTSVSSKCCLWVTKMWTMLSKESIGVICVTNRIYKNNILLTWHWIKQKIVSGLYVIIFLILGQLSYSLPSSFFCFLLFLFFLFFILQWLRYKINLSRLQWCLFSWARKLEYLKDTHLPKFFYVTLAFLNCLVISMYCLFLKVRSP